MSVVKYAAFWLLVAAVVYVGSNAFLSPKIARAVASDGTGAIIINRSHDQHFYVEGSINGHRVTFLVDTGATLVSVNRDVARAIGLTSSSPAIFDTAAGRSAGRVATNASVQVGPIRVDGIRVGVNAGGPVALLGQNFLNKVELRQGADQMTLRVTPQR